MGAMGAERPWFRRPSALADLSVEGQPDAQWGPGEKVHTHGDVEAAMKE